VVHAYAQIARDHSRPGGHTWLEQMLAAPPTAGRLLAAYAGARRRLGDAPIELSRAHEQALDSAGLELPRGWTCDEVGRAALLCTALAVLAPSAHAELVDALYAKGDTAERRALLRALSLLPGPERFLATAIEACRTNVVPVFEAIACENAYPERHFTDLAYNQLVLKSLFLEVPLARVRGLATRAGPELARMALDYAAERRAAGRSIPADIARIPGCGGERS